MIYPLGLVNTKQRGVFFVSSFVLLLACASTICWVLMLVLMSLYMSQAWLHSVVLPFVRLVYFNVYKTMALSRGWQWYCDTFTVIFHIHTRHFPNLLKCSQNSGLKSSLTMRSQYIYCCLSHPTSTLDKFTSMPTKQLLQV